MEETNVSRVTNRTDFRGSRLSWPAIWAGFIVATVAQIILSVIGIALGFSIWNPSSGGVGGFAIGAWIWFFVTAIVSLFLGGLAVGRLAGLLTRTDAFLHSVVLWGLSAVLAVWMIANGVGMLVGSALNVVTRTTAATVTGAMTATGALANRAAENPETVKALRDSVNHLLDSLHASGNLPSGGKIREAAGDVANKAATGTAIAAWVALATIILSLAAATWGAEIMTRKQARALRA